MGQEYLDISLKYFQYATSLTYQSAGNSIEVPESVVTAFAFEVGKNSIIFEAIRYALNIFGGDSNQAAAPKADLGSESSSSDWII